MKIVRISAVQTKKTLKRQFLTYFIAEQTDQTNISHFILCATSKCIILYYIRKAKGIPESFPFNPAKISLLFPKGKCNTFTILFQEREQKSFHLFYLNFF